MSFKVVRVFLGQSGQYLYDWIRSLQMILEPILKSDVGIVPFGLLQDECLSHPTLDWIEEKFHVTIIYV